MQVRWIVIGMWGVMWLLVGGLIVAPLVLGQQPPPAAPNTEYWQQYAETLAVSRQSCEQVQLQLRLQGAGDQRRLTELQQKITELEAKVKALEPVATSEK